jgi:hypothetical protein
VRRTPPLNFSALRGKPEAIVGQGWARQKNPQPTPAGQGLEIRVHLPPYSSSLEAIVWTVQKK